MREGNWFGYKYEFIIRVCRVVVFYRILIISFWNNCNNLFKDYVLSGERFKKLNI